MKNSGIEPWPDTNNVPMPVNDPPHGSDVHVANELFLSAIAWIFHHEISHVVLKHTAAETTYSTHQEKEADLRATDWILSFSRQPTESRKRGFGIATAIMTMLYLEKPGDSDVYVSRHPPAVQRLDYCLQKAGAWNDIHICSFTAVALQFLLAQWGIHQRLDGTSEQEILRNFMVSFATNGRS
jgi:hypothetical protein